MMTTSQSMISTIFEMHGSMDNSQKKKDFLKHSMGQLKEEGNENYRERGSIIPSSDLNVFKIPASL
jgi:hypothetical protein